MNRFALLTMVILVLGIPRAPAQTPQINPGGVGTEPRSTRRPRSVEA